MKRVIIVHGWDGYPEEGWFPWFKKELEEKGLPYRFHSCPHPMSREFNGGFPPSSKLLVRPTIRHFLSVIAWVVKRLFAIWRPYQQQQLLAGRYLSLDFFVVSLASKTMRRFAMWRQNG